MGEKILIIQEKPTEFIVNSLMNSGFKIILATNREESIKGIYEYIYVDIFKEDMLLQEVLKYHQRNKIDCVLSTWEGTADKCALVSKALGLKNNEYQSVLMSRDKLYTYYALSANAVGIPKTIVVNEYLENETRIEKEIGYPAIIKLRSSTNSQGVIKINSTEEYVLEVEQLNSILTNSGDDNRLRYLYKNNFTIIAQEYLEGKEVNIDLLYKNNRYLCVGIFEKEQMNGPYFPESMSVFPTSFTKQQEDEMVQLAWKGVKALGGVIGAAHVEIRYTTEGPKIIEMALRPGGAYTALAIEHLYSINIYEELVKILIYEDYFPVKKQTKLACLYAGILSSKEGTITAIEGIHCLEETEGMLDYVQIKQVGDYVTLPPQTSDPHIFHYILAGKTYEEVIRKHKMIKSTVNINIGI